MLELIEKVGPTKFHIAHCRGISVVIYEPFKVYKDVKIVKESGRQYDDDKTTSTDLPEEGLSVIAIESWQNQTISFLGTRIDFISGINSTWKAKQETDDGKRITVKVKKDFGFHMKRNITRMDLQTAVFQIPVFWNERRTGRDS